MVNTTFYVFMYLGIKGDVTKLITLRNTACGFTEQARCTFGHCFGFWRWVLDHHAISHRKLTRGSVVLHPASKAFQMSHQQWFWIETWLRGFQKKWSKGTEFFILSSFDNGFFPPSLLILTVSIQKRPLENKGRNRSLRALRLDSSPLSCSQDLWPLWAQPLPRYLGGCYYTGPILYLSS